MKNDSFLSIDDSQIKKFAKELQKYANSSAFRKEIALFLEAAGMEFLRIISDEIIRRQVVDTRLLLNSFTQGDKDNTWEASHGGLTLTVGTNVEYASYVNDGHWTNPKGVYIRFVPGVWEGDRFIYTPGAKTGMVLKQHWVEGAHYWEAAIRIFEAMFPKILVRKLQEWMEKFAKQSGGR